MSLKDNALTNFFDSILKGESKTYNDHNWYVGSNLSGYIEGGRGKQYSLLNKPLSEYTVGEVIDFQSRGRSGAGQLWATGRYQIIPATLKGIIGSAGVSKSDVYDKKTQDKLGLQLLKNRGAIKSYIYGDVPDTTENLNKAITQVAMTWSSVGVPQDMKGKKKLIKKGESYYSGGGDRASVKPEIVGDALKKLRAVITGVEEAIETVKKNPVPSAIITAILVTAIYILINQKNIK